MSRYDVVTSRKDKDGKWWSTNIGAAFEKDGRINIVLNSLPIGSDGQAFLTLFPAKPKKENPTKQQRPESNQDMNDDIPF